jgi:hypothetical protein
VVGQRERIELQFVRLVHQPVKAAGTVQQAILGMQVEMDKFRVRHRLNLIPCGDAAQAGDIRID